MKLENWALIRRQTREATGGLVLPQDYKLIKSYGLGELYEKNEAEASRALATSRVVEFESGKIITRSGSEYGLGEMHPDYQSFIEAHEKGVLILKNWRYSGGIMHGILFNGHIYEDTAEGFDDANYIVGKVVEQDIVKNTCYIQTSEGIKSVYVDWLSISTHMLLDLELNFLSQEEIQSLLPYAGKRVKLDIFGIHKEMLKKF